MNKLNKLSKFWWALIIAAFFVGMLNPYIGVVAAINFNELMFMGMFLFIAFVMKNIFASISSDSIKKILSMFMKIFSFAIPILFLVLSTSMEGIAFFSGMMNGTIYSPVELFSDSLVLCYILLLLSIIINVLIFIACLSRTKKAVNFQH